MDLLNLHDRFHKQKLVVVIIMAFVSNGCVAGERCPIIRTAENPLTRAPIVAEVCWNLPVAEEVATPETSVLIGYTHELLHLDDGYTLVARDGSRVVGFAGLHYDAFEQVLWLQGLFVQPGYRRWGIGTQLLGSARQTARGLGARRLLAQVRADNPGLVMFLRAGFAVCGFVQGREGTQLILGDETPGSEAAPAGP